MIVTVPDVMRLTRAYFPISHLDCNWAVTEGHLSPEAFLPGEWIAIEHDGPAGVYRLDARGRLPDVADTRWQGRIWRLSPPADFLRLCEEIAEWAAKHPDPTLASEQFGAYHYTRSASSWAEAFAAALRPYVRMYTEVNC